MDDDGNGLLQRLDTAARPPRGATEGAPSKRGARRTAGPLTPRGPPPIARPTMPRGAACAIWSRWRWPMRDKDVLVAMGGFAAGAGILFWLDPRSGARRRAKVGHQATHASRQAADAA